MCSPGKTPQRPQGKRKKPNPPSGQSTSTTTATAAGAVVISTPNRSGSYVLSLDDAKQLQDILYRSTIATKPKQLRWTRNGQRIRLDQYKYSAQAFEKTGLVAISMKNNHALVPTGDEADQYIFETVIGMIHEQNLDLDDPLLIHTLCGKLQSDKELHVVNSFARVTEIIQNTGVFAARAALNLRGSVAGLETILNGLTTVANKLQGNVDALGGRTTQLEANVQSLRHGMDNLGAQTQSNKSKIDKLREAARQVRDDTQTGFVCLRSQTGAEFQNVRLEFREQLQRQHATVLQHLHQFQSTVGTASDQYRQLWAQFEYVKGALQNLPDPAIFYSKNCTMNAEIRNGTADALTHREFNCFRYWLEHVPDVCKKTVFRGINIWEHLKGRSVDEHYNEGWTGVPAWLKSLLTPGNAFQDPAFLSTSRNFNVAWGFATLQESSADPVVPLIMTIHHRSGRYIQPYVAQQFDETVLLPNTRLKVIEVMKKLTGPSPNDFYIVVSMTEESGP